MHSLNLDLNLENDTVWAVFTAAVATTLTMTGFNHVPH